MIYYKIINLNNLKNKYEINLFIKIKIFANLHILKSYYEI